MKIINKTYQGIAEVAYKLIAELGIEKTSLSMIAREVGISKPAIYYHFPLRDYTKYNFKEWLIADGFRMISKCEENPCLLRVVNEFILITTRNEEYKQRLLTIQKDFLDGFSELLSLAVVSYQKKEVKAHMLSLLIDNMSNFILMGFKLDYKGIWEEAVINKDATHCRHQSIRHTKVF